MSTGNNSSVVRKYPIPTTFFNPEESHINLSGDRHSVSIGSVRPGYSNDIRALTISSEGPKAYMMIHASVYHFFMDIAGSILSFVENNPDVELILDTAVIKVIMNFQQYDFFNFFFNALKDQGYKVTIIDSTDNIAINIKDFWVIPNAESPDKAPIRLFNFFNKYIDNPNQKPYRDVYVSRKKIDNRPLPEERRVFGIDDDNRIDDHDALEKLFIDNGFEVIYPEDFKNFKEQINFFHSVRTLVSLTSSGIVNACFMQPNQTIVELVTPFIIDIQPNQMDIEQGYKEPRLIIEELHHFYQKIAFYKNHKYVGIQNWNRDHLEIEHSILEDPYMKLFFDRSKSKPIGIFKKWKS